MSNNPALRSTVDVEPGIMVSHHVAKQTTPQAIALLRNAAVAMVPENIGAAAAAAAAVRASQSPAEK